MLVDGKKFCDHDQRDDNEVHDPKNGHWYCGESTSKVAGLEIFGKVLSDGKQVLHAVVHEEHGP